MKTRVRPLLVGLMLLGLWPGGGLRAQVNWSAVPTGTTQNLWGVCYGGGRFVAVGEGGTILTSPDGATWTRQNSGVAGWMTSVTYALNHFVAVGENGTVLMSLDGVAWENISRRPPGPAAIRLNVVRFDGAAFMIYGEQNYGGRLFLPGLIDFGPVFPPATWWRGVASGLGHMVIGGQIGLVVRDANASYLGPDIYQSVAPIQNVTGIVLDHGAFLAVGAAGVIVSSADTKTWTVEASGTTANLNDVTLFNDAALAVGDGGTVLSRDGRGAWVRRSTPTTQTLLGAAGSDTTIVAVGFGGTILRSTAVATAPLIIAQPANVTETVGGAASFAVDVRGTPPLSYQWFRNGAPLAGETRSALTRTPLTPVDAGSYSVTVANSSGTATSSVASLSLLPAPPAIVDAGFHADESLDGTVTTLLPVSDGGVLVVMGSLLISDAKPARLIKLRVDGSRDPAWTESVFGPVTASSTPFITTVVAQPDGRVLVGGGFSSVNGQAAHNLIRLNRDGSIDPAFGSAAELASAPVRSLSLYPDGRIAVASLGLTPFRLLADGSLDPGFRPQPLAPGLTPNFNQPRDWAMVAVSAAPDGKLFAAGVADLRFTLGFPIPRVQVVRFNVDGSLDSSFNAVQWGGFFDGLRALNDGVLVVGATAPPGQFGAQFANIWRLRNDGSSDPTHAQPTIAVPRVTYVYPDGAVIVPGSDASHGLVRFDARGVLDPTFTGGVGLASVVAATTNNQVYVGGAFEIYNGQAEHFVARLNAVTNGSVNAPRILGLTADKVVARVGEPITVRAAVTGSANLSYDWSGVAWTPNGPKSTTSPTLTFTALVQGANLTLTVRNPAGEAVSTPLTFTILPEAPVITNQPTRVSAQSGRDLLLTVQPNDTAGRLDIEWRRDGQIVTMPALDGWGLSLPKVTTATAGIYSVTYRNALGESVTSAPIVLTTDDSSRLANLSTRAFVGPGEQVLIAGFSISGVRTRKVLIRAIGPGLAKFGVAGALPNPQLKLIEARTGQDYSLSFSKDGWDANVTGTPFLGVASAQVGAFPLDAGSKDNAGVAQLSPGNYTVQIFDKSGQTGTALVEIYEFDNDAARMLNVSSRAMVTPASPAICGLSIQGPVAKRVLLRGVGPTLGLFGITGTLTNPRLTLKDANGATLAVNDDWEANANVAELRTTMPSVGAFPFAAGSKDAALLMTLPPGNYTMIAEGAANASGVALVEAYEVP